MLSRIRKLMSPPGVRGMTLIEVLVAMVVLTSALLSIASLISVGLLQLNNIRIQRAASNCARLVTEYLSTLPPDVIYAMSPGSPMYGDFDAGGGVPGLNSFVNSGSYDACRKLSDPSNPAGKKVNMTYGVCPGCHATTMTDPVTGIAWTACIYLIRIRVLYSGFQIGGRRTIDFFVKRFTGTAGKCTDSGGCGTGTAAGTLKDCNW